MSIKCYSELIKINTFNARLEYLKTNSKIGVDTFGFDRYLNQQFYKSNEWLRIRDYIISRDNGCDLGLPGYEIPEGIVIHIHHLNPITLIDIQQSRDLILDPEYLITTSSDTHKRIHYGIDKPEHILPSERTPNDMCPWKR